MAENLPKEILHFLDKSSRTVGKHKAEGFYYDNWHYLRDNSVDSPIEQMLHIAFDAVREMGSDPLSDVQMFNGREVVVGLDLRYQVAIGRYRVDFVASFGRIFGAMLDKYEYEEVIIECDSQKFHERTEEERRYEKARDRFLQVKGYKVFHYTGREILKEPYRVACEIIGYLTHTNPEELLLCCQEEVK